MTSTIVLIALIPVAFVVGILIRMLVDIKNNESAFDKTDTID